MIYKTNFPEFYAAREDKLNADNRSVVNKFESELTQDIKSLSKINNLNALKSFVIPSLTLMIRSVVDSKKKVALTFDF